ncbi:DeoR/GlpR family DNA-binding transcription regulator [Alkalibaculum bacchi]|uniref:DeoR/GlpR family DNA-binding transcription regulator n=1 Tax=Alkalibaculum bacchi TaxID=645887 RepID=UPI0026EE3596|nr:DeoR/GlpR family DNA-binding transcription regulator [Alkalibaculum bacchi]
MITSRKIVERRNQIVEIINQNGMLRIADAIKLFKVSDETIRKDFAYLEEHGILKKVHGGAIANESDIISPVSIRKTENYDLKLKLATKAIELFNLKDNIIGLDIGSTITVLASLYAKMSDNIFITNSFPATQELISSKNTLICTGGEYHPHDMCFRGELAKNALQTFAMDVCFLGSSGVLHRDGICTTSFFDIDIKKELILRSRKSVVLLDHSKFEKSSLVQVADWSEIDLVITDDNIPNDNKSTISNFTELIII